MTKKKPGGIVTQVDIARAVKCSQNTVALALRGSTRISEARRQEIQEVAKKMGYRPNLAARGLRRGRSGLVGVISTELDDPRTAFARSILSDLHSTNCKPILGVDADHTKPWYEAAWIETFLQLQVEAIISFAWHDDPVVPPWHEQIPVIFSGNQPSDQRECDAVSVDRARGSRMAVEYLIGKGHREIAMLPPRPSWQYTDGYEQAMVDAKLMPRIFTGEQDEPIAVRHARFLESLKTSDSPATAACVIDSREAGELCTMAMREGISIPDRLAVIGCGYLPLAERFAVPLTVIQMPIEELVRTTIEVVRNRLAAPDAPRMQIELPYQLLPRESA